MKKITFSISILFLLGLISCQNEDWEFPDYTFKGVYFPYQYPVRTLVLGDYKYNNENDNNLKFLITARIGGMYENKSNWTLDYVVDESYTQNLLTTLGDTIKPLPINYYTLNPINTIVIPKGQFYGTVEVQLTEAFLTDDMAYRTHYVIPLEIMATNADSILQGNPSIVNADPRIAGNWVVVPKNFTLFGIKYVNPYHGKYLHRGQSIVKNGMGDVIETIVYRQRYVELDEVWKLNTTGKNKVILTATLRKSPTSPGPMNLELSFDDNNNCIITSTSGFSATGSGKWVKDGDEWGGQKRDAIYLSFTVDDGTHIHSITDTLVFRDKAVKFEEFLPQVY